jgi:transcription elongation factor S-II
MAVARDLSDFLRHVRVAVEAAEQVKDVPDANADVTRCCDVLELLWETEVTAEQLANTKAGKIVRKLTTHENKRIKAAATRVVNTWKASISRQLAAKAQPGPAAAPAERSLPPATAAPSPAASIPTTPVLTRQESDAPQLQTPRAPFKKPDALGDTERDNIRKGLAQALLQAVVDDFEDVESPYVLAAGIEGAMYTHFGERKSDDYKAKARKLLFNLKDKNNPDLRRRVVLEEVTPELLIGMTSEELASDARRQENDKIRAQMKKETERTEQVCHSTEHKPKGSDRGISLLLCSSSAGQNRGFGLQQRSKTQSERNFGVHLSSCFSVALLQVPLWNVGGRQRRSGSLASVSGNHLAKLMPKKCHRSISL